MNNDLTYWVALALIRQLTTRRKNEIYIQCFRQNKSIVDLFEDPAIKDMLEISDEEYEIIVAAKSELPNVAFLVEDMINQGYHILPMVSPDYPQALKSNLKTNVPTVIYAKGNIQLLNAPSIAIVGSRKADNLALSFTDNVARMAAAYKNVVVSGFAKGVDKQALDSALDANGRSIIVLPQGILTFASGFKQYYRSLINGNLVVISEFAPKAGWSVGLAMARNTTIYALATQIYVAQSDDKGGTWEGASTGLKQHRPIFVRMSATGEKNANNLLIQMGATPVDINGNIISAEDMQSITTEDDAASILNEKIRKSLQHSPLNTKDLINAVGSDMSESKMRTYLATLDFVEKYRQKNKIFYRIKGDGMKSLFDIE